MKRLESNLKNMVLSLTIVSLVAAALLGGMYVLTYQKIQDQEAAKQVKAKTEVMLQSDNLTFDQGTKVNDITVYKAFLADSLIGYAVETFDDKAFSGLITLMVGFDTNGVITGYSVLKHNETPGLGANMETWFKTEKGRQNVIGLDPAQTNLTVSKEGGDVDAITAATITSRAFLRALNSAYKAIGDIENIVEEVESVSADCFESTDSIATTEDL